jgi:hypothetical protein
MSGGKIKMAEQFGLEQLEDLPTNPVTDEIADKYNGTKVKVKSVEPGSEKTSWKDGKQLPQGQTIEVPVVFVETEVFGTDAFGQPLKVKESLKLQTINGKIGFRGDMSKGKRFMRMLKINSIKDAVGREVLIIKKVSKTRSALVISIPE